MIIVHHNQCVFQSTVLIQKLKTTRKDIELKGYNSLEHFFK